MPQVPFPEELPESLAPGSQFLKGLSPRLRQLVCERPIEFRVVPVSASAAAAAAPRQYLWIRTVDRLPDGDRLHSCLLAYASDFHLLGTALMQHEDVIAKGQLVIASIDHVMWFHRPARMDEWMLYAADSPSASGARGYTRGSLFTREGVLVASTSQEGLVRVVPASSD